MAGACSVYTIQPCTSLLCHFIQSHIHRMHVCLAVTCHLPFSQIDQDMLCATAVMQGWNGYWLLCQLRKLTLKKKILPPLLPGLKPMTFWSWVWCCTTELPPLPKWESRKSFISFWLFSWWKLKHMLSMLKNIWSYPFCFFYQSATKNIFVKRVKGAKRKGHRKWRKRRRK